MNLRRFFVGRAIGTLVVVAILVAYFGIKSLASDSEPVSENYRATLIGEYICLPESVIESSECIPGIHTYTGEYYAVSFVLMSQTADPLEEGEHFQASGVVTPVEMLSAAVWQRSGVTGIFSVTDSLEVR
jgi:hypothetical protein